MGKKFFFLIRHAQPDYPGGEKMCLGKKSDLPLSAQGYAQADQLAQFLAPLPIEAVYSSPLLRARQTAAPIAGGSRPLHLLDALTELDGGAWDGLTFSQIEQRWPRHTRTSTCPPGGESDESGLARVRAAFDQIERETLRCAAIVAHSGLNRLLLCSLAGQPLSEKKRYVQDFACVCPLMLHDGRFTIGSARLTAQEAAALFADWERQP